MNSFTLLPWDTSFFGFKVARVLLEDAGRAEFEHIIQRIKEEHIRLTYFFVLSDTDNLNGMVNDAGGLLVDEKITFSKIPGFHTGISNIVVEYRGTGEESELVDLALQAGLYSRFRLDDNFRNGEYERLYKSWLENSITGKIAFNVLIATVQDKIAGLLTLGAKGDHAEIGLLSVDEKYRGKGIGKDLVYYADNIAFMKQYGKIKVATQMQNEGACILYGKCGFEIESKISIYHLWQ